MKINIDVENITITRDSGRTVGWADMTLDERRQIMRMLNQLNKIII